MFFIRTRKKFWEYYWWRFFSFFFPQKQPFRWFLGNCPCDFDQTLHVLSNDNWVFGDTKFMPEVTSGGPRHSPKRGKLDVFFALFLVFGSFLKNCPYDFAETHSVTSPGQYLSPGTKFTPVVFPGGWQHSLEKGFLSLFLTIFGLIRFFLKNCP